MSWASRCRTGLEVNLLVGRAAKFRLADDLDGAHLARLLVHSAVRTAELSWLSDLLAQRVCARSQYSHPDTDSSSHASQSAHSPNETADCNTAAALIQSDAFTQHGCTLAMPILRWQ